jgi:glycopeptide antibiotics resistance protein
VTPHRRLLAARIAYVAIVLLATLSQLDFSSNLDDASMRLHRALMPSLGWRDAIDGLRNAVLFAGLGVVWVTTSLTGNIAREIRVATLTSFLLSAAVEACQIFSPVRTASLIDVTTDTLGGLAGAIAATMLLVALRNARRDRSYLGIPMLLFAGPYAIAVLCEALAPLFQSSAVPAGDGGPLGDLVVMLQLSRRIDWGGVEVVDIPLFAAAGFLLTTMARERSGAVRDQWIAVAAIGAVTIALAHIAHGMISLPIGWEAVIVDCASIVLGAWMADRWLGNLTQRFRGAARARVVIATYVALLILWGWRPLIPETRLDVIVAQLDANAFIPLARLADRVDAFSALHVGQQFFLYLPLGALLAVWPVRMSGRWSNLWPAVLIVLAIELGHIIVAGRTFDVTNALLAWAGLATGWIAVRRSGYRPYGSAWRPTHMQPIGTPRSRGARS